MLLVLPLVIKTMHARAHKYAGDLWGVENRDRLFDIPEAAIKVCVCLRGARARESESERESVCFLQAPSRAQTARAVPMAAVARRARNCDACSGHARTHLIEASHQSMESRN